MKQTCQQGIYAFVVRNTKNGVLYRLKSLSSRSFIAVFLSIHKIQKLENRTERFENWKYKNGTKNENGTKLLKSGTKANTDTKRGHCTTHARKNTTVNDSMHVGCVCMLQAQTHAYAHPQHLNKRCHYRSADFAMVFYTAEQPNDGLQWQGRHSWAYNPQLRKSVAISTLVGHSSSPHILHEIM